MCAWQLNTLGPGHLLQGTMDRGGGYSPSRNITRTVSHLSRKSDRRCKHDKRLIIASVAAIDYRIKYRISTRGRARSTGVLTCWLTFLGRVQVDLLHLQPWYSASAIKLFECERRINDSMSAGESMEIGERGSEGATSSKNFQIRFAYHWALQSIIITSYLKIDFSESQIGAQADFGLATPPALSLQLVCLETVLFTTFGEWFGWQV